MSSHVTHSLIIDINQDDIALITINSASKPLSVKNYHLVDDEMLNTILSDLDIYFENIYILARNQPFVMVNDEFFEIKKGTEVFKHFYYLSSDQSLKIDEIDKAKGVLYRYQKSIYNSISKKFPTQIWYHEAALVIKKVEYETGFKTPKIFISININQLIIYAGHDGQMILCNAFFVKNSDDVFYFTMLAVEQLNFKIEKTELIILGNLPDKEHYFEKFKNYFSEINMWIEEFNNEFISDSENKWLETNFAIQQLLFCE